MGGQPERRAGQVRPGNGSVHPPPPERAFGCQPDCIGQAESTAYRYDERRSVFI